METIKGFCHCGCGQKTIINDGSDSSKKWLKGEPRKWIRGHGPRKPKTNDRGYVYIFKPDHPRCNPQGYVREHIVRAEEILGKHLPAKVVIHHPNKKTNNHFFVICENQSYHDLIHQRQRAYEASGNPRWRKCNFCKKWDDPANLHIVASNAAHHQKCEKEKMRKYYLSKISNDRDTKLPLFLE